MFTWAEATIPSSLRTSMTTNRGREDYRVLAQHLSFILLRDLVLFATGPVTARLRRIPWGESLASTNRRRLNIPRPFEQPFFERLAADEDLWLKCHEACVFAMALDEQLSKCSSMRDSHSICEAPVSRQMILIWDVFPARRHTDKPSSTPCFRSCARPYVKEKLSAKRFVPMEPVLYREKMIGVLVFSSSCQRLDRSVDRSTLCPVSACFDVERFATKRRATGGVL